MVVQVVHVYHFLPQGQVSGVVSLVVKDLGGELLLSFFVRVYLIASSAINCANCLVSK